MVALSPIPGRKGPSQRLNLSSWPSDPAFRGGGCCSRQRPPPLLRRAAGLDLEQVLQRPGLRHWDLLVLSRNSSRSRASQRRGDCEVPFGSGQDLCVPPRFGVFGSLPTHPPVQPGSPEPGEGRNPWASSFCRVSEVPSRSGG